ncbi:hypothetical protein D9757_006538 [Collybiopsis confluens]|uniref:Uncharacterized protein n=1 Tax=Collybiopsis confluens TaxID=2823264 RepID=A0A8H5MB36_9AGAR|nr:hypothetical protein D9757_006538 [Collybiopsis confluens]
MSINPSNLDAFGALTEAELKNLGLDSTENEQLLENLSQLDVQDDNASQFSHYSTPTELGGRQGTSFTTAKRYLTAWLAGINQLRCPFTFAKPSGHRVIEIAHLMMPQSASADDVRKLGFVLGMRASEMSIHSRLYLMPLRKDVHSLVDCQRLLMFPSIEELRLATIYLQTIGEYNPDRNSMTETTTWMAVRKGSTSTLPVKFDALKARNFENLREGLLHEYKVVASPFYRDSHDINTVLSGNTIVIAPPFLVFPKIRTHVSPFAVALRTLHALESPATLCTFDSKILNESRNQDNYDMIQNLVIRALLGAEYTAGDEVLDVVTEDTKKYAAMFSAFTTAFDRRCRTAEIFRDPSVRGSGTSYEGSLRSLKSKGSLTNLSAISRGVVAEPPLFQYTTPESNRSVTSIKSKPHGGGHGGKRHDDVPAEEKHHSGANNETCVTAQLPKGRINRVISRRPVNFFRRLVPGERGRRVKSLVT